jgi:arginine-tRNA-protein transferase
MQSLYTFLTAPSSCGYLPDETWQLQHHIVGQMSAAEYQPFLMNGWRRFGAAIFRPQCPACQKCRSLRVVVDAFRPNRSQRRAWTANQDVQVHVGTPSVTREKLLLYDRYHAFQSENKGWPEHEAKDASSYTGSFVNNPFPTQEWCYYLGKRLVGVGYVDDLPGALSAIYFFYDPDERQRSLGTYNVLSIIDYARRKKVPHVYLGYFVEGCASMAYKAAFKPHQLLDAGGAWGPRNP